MRLSNTAALAQQPNPAAASDQRPPIDYVEPDAPTPITNGGAQDLVENQGGTEPTPFPFRSSGAADPSIGQGIGRRAVAFYSRISEGWRLRAGDNANGLHAVIARQANGFPVGEQTPWPKQSRSTLFRQPDPWDRGAVAATPGADNAAS